MIIAMAGLPGVGKTTLSTALARNLGAAYLNKDRVRAALFSRFVDYTREQDDVCVSVMYRATEYLLEKNPGTLVIIDGCTYTRSHQVDGLTTKATSLRQRLVIFECDCPPETAVRRLRADMEAGAHPARNRTPELYWRFRKSAEAINAPTHRVDTALAVEDCVTDCLRYLHTHIESDSDAARPLANHGGSHGG